MIAKMFIAAAGLALTTSVVQAADAGGDFLKKAIEGNYAEVQMGDLAQKNGQSDAVKTYGKMLAADHGKANQTALTVAKTMGLAPPAGPNADQKKMFDHLAQMKGADFDKMFATHMVEDHKKDIDEYQKGAKASGEVGKYAEAQLPTLKEHLDKATALPVGK